LKFKEIEHKFLVDDSFDLISFKKNINKNILVKDSYRISVVDTYYLIDGIESYIYRHRYDSKSQYLTVKTFGGDNEERTEVNLALFQGEGDQRDAVDAFMGTLGISWSGTIQKDVEVFYSEDCEIVHYLANSDGREVSCVEFESRNAKTKDEAVDVLYKYEEMLGFDSNNRSRLSIFEIFFKKYIK